MNYSSNNQKGNTLRRPQVSFNPGMPVKKMEELWEMNIHENPIDQETAQTLQQHQKQLFSHNEPFVLLISAKEQERKQLICKRLYNEKIKTFIEEDYPQTGVSLDQIKQDFEQRGDDDEMVFDLNSFAKSSKIVGFKPEKFECMLGQYSVQQEPIDRQYRTSLGYYEDDPNSKQLIPEEAQKRPQLPVYKRETECPIPTQIKELSEKSEQQKAQFLEIFNDAITKSQQKSIKSQDQLIYRGLSSTLSKNKQYDPKSVFSVQQGNFYLAQASSKFYVTSSSNKLSQRIALQEKLKSDIINRQLSLSKMDSSADKMRQTILTLGQGGKLRADLSRSTFYNQNHQVQFLKR